jgi:hypothetical protein
MIFTVAIISPSTTGLNAGKRREGDRLVDPVEAVDGRFVDHQHAGGLRKQIGAAGKGAVDVHALPATAVAISAAALSSDTSPGSSRATTTSLMPAASSAATSGRPDQRALLEHQRTLADGVDRGGAFSLPRRDRAELHEDARVTALMMVLMQALAAASG